jgi:hypothetical protein
VSRAGRQARRERLIRDGVWEPSSILTAAPSRAEADRARALIADRDGWIQATGILGWQREQARRRAVRTARSKDRRQRSMIVA